ncbi:sigma-70 family RNA polymerase sigma factor [Streptomyces sp. NPDC004732]|uniref:RNA polymerase sigma factor n=1 Tax=Streptomyces sp. NPDC004732 TaxID=3154290 RepID=UPI0033B1EFAB
MDLTHGTARWAHGTAERVPDTELVARCRAGDREAFAELAARHRAKVYAVCLRVTGNPEDAADAAQETLTRTWRGLVGFHGTARFSTWLYRITVNAALAEVERRAARPRPAGLDMPDETYDVPAVAERVVTTLSVQAALDRVPPEYRAAIVLRECLQCSYAEVGEILGIPLNTVKSRISRARQALLVLLGPDPDEGAEDRGEAGRER